MSQAVCIISSGMISAVGHNAPSSCAAIRCAIDNFQESRFLDSGGEWQMVAEVQHEQPWRGRTKLVKLAAAAILEALSNSPVKDASLVPLLLGVAEKERPGRLANLDESLIKDIERELNVRFHTSSAVIPRGRVSGAIALLNARKLIYQAGHQHVLIAGVDSFLNGETLAFLDSQERLLTSRNSNGFIPGEGAAAVLLSAPTQSPAPQLGCIGLGFGVEEATVTAEDVAHRAEGLTQAIRNALVEANCGLEAMDYRLTDLSGEQYYFKEAALALSRVLRVRKEHFHLYHPADCIGECGAAIGPAMLVVALAACRKGYGEGANIFCHLGNDAGERAAMLLSYQTVRVN